MVLDSARLAAFAAVARTGGFSKAAKELGKTQSSVSQAVLLLERELGQSLFSRDGHTPRLTDAGQALLIRATRIFDEMALAESELAGLGALQFGKLVLGTSDTLACYFLPPVFAAFRERFPKLELRIQNRPSPVVAELVSERAVDIGIVSLPLPESLLVSGRSVAERLDCESLGAQEDVAVCAPSHPLSRRRRLSLRDLEPYPLLLLDRSTSSRAQLDAAFASEGIQPNVAMDMNSVEVLKRLAELDFGVAIVPRFAVAREAASGTLAVLALERGGAPRSVGALTPRAFAVTRAARAFLELARAHSTHSRPRRSSSSSESE